jgi:hypothetical protein
MFGLQGQLLADWRSSAVSEGAAATHSAAAGNAGDAAAGSPAGDGEGKGLCLPPGGS